MRIDRTIAVDWSGDQRAGHRKIWLCEVADGQVRRLERGRGRTELADHLVAEARRDPHLAVGLDFAFSFPAPFLEKRGRRTIDQVWDEVAEHGEEWLATCPNPPFWGKPGKKKPTYPDDHLHFRATELTAAAGFNPGPFSVFQIGGAGAVGVGSIRGMPHLRSLRAAGFAIWPFDPPATPLVVEIWPRLFMGPVKKSDPAHRHAHLAHHHPDLPAPFRRAAESSDDAFDALLSALAMDRHRPELAALEPPSDPVTRLEGAIWRPEAAGEGGGGGRCLPGG